MRVSCWLTSCSGCSAVETLANRPPMPAAELEALSAADWSDSTRARASSRAWLRPLESPWISIVRDSVAGMGVGSFQLSAGSCQPERGGERERREQDKAVKDIHKAFPKVLPPLPHIRFGIRSGLHCGGEGRGEGVRAVGVAPSPPPSPPQHAPSEIHVSRGGEGAGSVSKALMTWALRNPSRRCPLPRLTAEG